MSKILDHLMNQIHQPSNLEVLEELQKYCKTESNLFQNSQSISWLPRVIHTAESMVILLENNVEQWLSGEWVEENKILKKSADFFKLLEEQARHLIDPFKELSEAMYEKMQDAESSNISKSACRNLANSCETFLNKSDSSAFPDIIRNDDYPLTEIGSDSMPCLKGDRPVNVPDGVELKSKRGHDIRLDTHGPKTGLFLQTCWDWNTDKSRIKINGIYVSYFNSTEFLRGKANSRDTTIKWNPDYESLRKRGNAGFIGIDGAFYRGITQPSLFDIAD
jgi:hypothetical protein